VIEEAHRLAGTSGRQPLETGLLLLDKGPLHPFRVLAGFLFGMVWVRFCASCTGTELTVALLIALVAMRIGPAVLRAIVPVPKRVRQVWSRRRAPGKRFDSYQWQKLLWFGLGLAIALVIAAERTRSLWTVTSFCLIAGTAGLLAWRRHSHLLVEEEPDIAPAPPRQP
jgi:hypothetical protein